MARKEKEEQTSGGGSSWLTTYTDLCTLLLTFFVLLLTMSVIDPERKKEALNSLVGAFGFLPGGRSPIGAIKSQDIREASEPMVKSSPLSYDFLKELTIRNNLDPHAEIIKEEDRIVIRINNKLLFKEGEHQLSPEGEKFIALLGLHLKDNFQEVEVRGHTDAYEMVNHPNWMELSWKISAERALVVYKKLIEVGVHPRRISAHGMSYFHPVVDSIKHSHLREQNRRVEIIIGRNPTLPTSIYNTKPPRKPLFEYKNFLFKLFPTKEGT